MKKDFTFKSGKLNVTLDLLSIVVFIIMLVIGYFYEFIITLTSIFLHELGHILTALYLGCKVTHLRILPIGLNAVLDNNMSGLKERLAINLSGPLTNVFLAFFSYIIKISGFTCIKQIDLLIAVNIYLAIFNLLPVFPLDGGRILRDAIIERYGIFFGSKFVRCFSMIFSFFVILIGIFQLLRSGHNFSLAIIGLYILSFSNFKEMEAAVMNIKSIVYRRSRLLKKGIYPARDLVVVQSVPISEILKNMDFDRFHIIHVLDEELKLIKIFTEQEIIDGMLKYDTDMTFEEFMKRTP